MFYRMNHVGVIDIHYSLVFSFLWLCVTCCVFLFKFSLVGPLSHTLQLYGLSQMQYVTLMFMRTCKLIFQYIWYFLLNFNKIFAYILRFSLCMNYFIPVFYCTCTYFGDLSQCLELQKSIYTQNFFAVYLFGYTIIYGGFKLRFLSVWNYLQIKIDLVWKAIPHSVH